MPRRRVLQVAAGAFVAVAFPGLTRSARAAPSSRSLTCGPGTEPCSRNGLDVCMPAGGTCCYFSPEESGYTFGLTVGCEPNTRCGDAKGERCICNANRCGSDCCAQGFVCLNLTIGDHTRKTCGRKCPAGEHRCGGTTIPAQLTCCPNGKCCGEDCCSGDQVCVTGLGTAGNRIKLCRLKCKDGMVRCNFVCCKPGDRAYKKRPNGRVTCLCAPG